MNGREKTLYSAMHRVAAAMMRSPRHAPAGASRRPAASAIVTPSIATATPAVLRGLSGSIPSTRPATIVINGSVASASVPRATVVKPSATL